MTAHHLRNGLAQKSRLFSHFVSFQGFTRRKIFASARNADLVFRAVGVRPSPETTTFTDRLARRRSLASAGVAAAI
jgi:hypothetical protein